MMVKMTLRGLAAMVALAAAVTSATDPKDCGEEHLKCCGGTDCNSNDLVCVEDIDACQKCGHEGEPACDGGKCGDGLVAVDGKCQEEEAEACGGIGELPCDDTGCDRGKSTSQASGGVCVTSCGEPAWTCCDGESRCLRDNLTCVDVQGEDQDGIPFSMACVECGGEGEPVCHEPGADECEEDDLVNVNDVCTEEVVCGGVGEAPCKDTACDGDLVEVDGMCAEEVVCGGVGEVPCKDFGCDDDLVEVDGKCAKEVVCGGVGEAPCKDTGCDGDLVEVDGKCAEEVVCGGVGEVPCKDTGCDGDLVEVDGKCAKEKAVCGGAGEEPCKDTGCDSGETASAAGGLCVDGCGDPGWVCCDGPPRCKRHSLTCVNKVGEDKDGVLFKMSCVDCGGAGEPVCTEEGAENCEAGLEDVDGVCEEVKEKVSCGGAGEEPCDDTGCDKPLIEVDGSCERCGANGEPLCADGCNDGFEPFSDADDDLCVPIEEEEECGGDGEEPCKDTGCDGNLVDVDGVCGEEEEEDCGGIGELPCKDTGCDNDKSTSEASGGVCVTSCGEPAWTCCDGSSRCLRHSLTCVDSKGEDQDGVPFKMACVECGGEGEPICEEEGAEECDDGLVNVHGVCEHK